MEISVWYYNGHTACVLKYTLDLCYVCIWVNVKHPSCWGDIEAKLARKSYVQIICFLFCLVVSVLEYDQKCMLCNPANMYEFPVEFPLNSNFVFQFCTPKNATAPLWIVLFRLNLFGTGIGFTAVVAAVVVVPFCFAVCLPYKTQKHNGIPFHGQSTSFTGIFFFTCYMVCYHGILFSSRIVIFYGFYWSKSMDLCLDSIVYTM